MNVDFIAGALAGVVVVITLAIIFMTGVYTGIDYDKRRASTPHQQQGGR